MARAPQIGTVTEDGKVTVSLGFRAWGSVIAAVIIATAYVLNTQRQINESADHVKESKITEARQDSVLAAYKWRLSRLERKTGIQRRERRDRRERDQSDD